VLTMRQACVTAGFALLAISLLLAETLPAGAQPRRPAGPPARRFLLGLDINNAERLQVLDQLVAYYRLVLGQLAPATAEKLAFKNARRLLGLDSQ